MTVREFLEHASKGCRVEDYAIVKTTETHRDELMGDLVEVRCTQVKTYTVSAEEYADKYGDYKLVGFWAISKDVIGIYCE